MTPTWGSRGAFALIALACLLPICLSIHTQPAHAQAITYEPTPTSPPGVRLILLIDDSSTMQDGRNPTSGNPTLNSAATSNPSLVTPDRRRTTDPNALRWQVARRLIDTLQADAATTHYVAVYSFADDVRRKSGTEADPFVQLGGQADATNYNALIAAAVPDHRFNPGQTLEALQAAQVALAQTANQAGTTQSSLVPAVLLITDDVPIDTFGDSPWQSITAWGRVTESVTSTVAQLKSSMAYNGSFCPQADGTMFAVIALGAATWVNADGSVPGPGQGNYFDALVSRNQNGEPLLTMLDPDFRDEGAMLAGMREAADRLLRDLRCVESELLTGGIPDAGFTRFSFENSVVFSQARLIIESAENAPITITPPNGVPIAAGAEGARRLNSPDVREVWSVQRGATTDNWAGPWVVEVATSGAVRVALQRDWSLSGITIEPQPPFGAEVGTHELQFKIDVDGVPLTDVNVLLPELAIVETGRSEVVPLVPGDLPGVFLATLVRNAPTNLDFTPQITVQRQVRGSTLFSTGRPLSFPDAAGGFVFTGSALVARLNVPDEGTVITCPDGTFASIVEVEQPGGSSLSAENIGASTQVDIIARLADGAEQTVGALSYNPLIGAEGQFSGEIDCALLQPDSTLTLFARARTAGGEIVDSSPRSVQYPRPTATPTPTSTATPPPTPLVPTATPAPAEPNPGEAVADVFLTPWFAGVSAVALAALLIPFTYRSLVASLPFRDVIVQHKSPDGRRLTYPLTSGLSSWAFWRRSVPLWGETTAPAASSRRGGGTHIFEGDAQAEPAAAATVVRKSRIVDVLVAENGTLQVRAHVDLIVNDFRTIRPGESAAFTEQALVLRTMQGWTYKLIDRRTPRN